MNDSAEISATSNPAETDTIAVRERVVYGLGGFAQLMVLTPATSFIVYFYTDIARIAVVTVGTMLLLSRVFDLFNPIMGLLVDRTRTRFGTCRPWLLWTAIPLGISFVLMFTVPGFGPTGKIIWAFITYNLVVTIGYTAIDVPYSALLVSITSDQHQRTLLSFIRMFLAMSGGLVAYAITQPTVKFFSGGEVGWQRMSLVFGAIATVLLLACFAGTKERILAPSTGGVKVPLRVTMNALIRNKYWMLLLVVNAAVFLMAGLGGAGIYFCRYFLQDPNRFGPLMTAYQVALILGMLLVGPMLKRLGKRNAALLGIGLSVVGQAIVIIAPTSLTIVTLGTIIKGFGFAPIVGGMYALIADSIEFGEWEYGVRTAGLGFGVVALVSKLFIGLGSVLVGWILGMGGYSAGAPTQSVAVFLGIKAMFIYIPLALYIVMGIVLWFYDLDKRYPSILADLKARQSTNANAAEMRAVSSTAGA